MNMDSIKAYIMSKVKDPTTYCGIALVLLTRFPWLETQLGLTPDQTEKALAIVVAAACVWIDGRLQSTKDKAAAIAATKAAQK